jgi:AbrB family looped-hinge helix DNA binding protein
VRVSKARQQDGLEYGRGSLNGMRATIDRAGRIVVPKSIRDRLMLAGGEELEVDEIDGRIVIGRTPRDVELVETRHGLLAADPRADLPGLGPADVREVLERTRR